MKYKGFSFVAIMLLLLTASAHAQTNTALTPAQKEMLKSPGSHLCGDAVTNVPCDELAKKQEEWRAEKYAQTSYQWKELTPRKIYALRPVEGKPNIMLVAVRGETLSEPVNVAFYVVSSPTCKALANPVDGPASGSIGVAGLVDIDGKNYALDGWCDGGNLTLTPSYWVSRQALLNSVKSNALMDVWFKDKPPSGFHLHYPTAGFSQVLRNLDVNP